MANYTRCTIKGTEVEFKRVPVSGRYAVGVNGLLIGTYESDSEAIVAALEHVRVKHFLNRRPMLPGRVRNDLREMASES